MTRRSKYIIASLIVLISMMSVLFVEPSKEFLFSNAVGDCSGRSSDIYHFIYGNTPDPEILLLGSSRMMNGVNDSLLNASRPNTYLNMGYCRFGNDLFVHFAEEFLKKHKTKKILFEIREEDGGEVHPMIAYLEPLSKIVEQPLRSDLIPDLYQKWLTNLKYVRGNFYGKNDYKIEVPSNKYWANLTTTPMDAFNEKRRNDSVEFLQLSKEPELTSVTTTYLEKLKQLCKKKNIELTFLFLPSYGRHGRKPWQMNDYLRWGDIIIPPDSITSDPANFADPSHLNRRGASQLSLWLDKVLNGK